MSITKPSHRHPILAVLFPSSAPQLTLANVAKYTSSVSGLDKTLMLLQYPPRLIAPGLLLLARLLLRERTGNGSRISQSLVKLVARMNAMAGAVGDARTMMRLLGLIPILAAVKSSLLSSTSLFATTDRTITSLQLLSLLCYYPLEHIVLLTSKSVLSISPSRAAKYSLWSVRFWALYVMLDVWALKRRWDGLRIREKVLKVEDGEDEKGEGTKRLQLDKDWEKWTEEAMVDAGYAPLTIHWSMPTGLWTSPGWTGLFGTIAAVSGIRSGWRNMGSK